MRDCEEEGEPVRGVGSPEATAPYAPNLVEEKFSEGGANMLHIPARIGAENPKLLLLPIIQRYDSTPLGHPPKPDGAPDGAMEGCRPLEVLYDDCVGTAQGALGESGRGLARLLRKPYLNSHS